MSFDELWRQFIDCAKQFGPNSLHRLIHELAEMINAGRAPSPKEGEGLLLDLRGMRCFSALEQVAELLEGNLTPQGRICYVQALIELGKLYKALSKLNEFSAGIDSGNINETLKDSDSPALNLKSLRSECLGLLGRCSKQLFVSDHSTENFEEAAKHLQKAIEFHSAGFELDDDKAWHGANLAALIWRAEKEGIPLGDNVPSAVSFGKSLEEIQRNLTSPWDLSALAQAQMAQEQWDKGLEDYQRYILMLCALQRNDTPFILMGDLRQLQEIWQLDQDGDGPRGSILRAVAGCIFQRPEGSVQLTLDAIDRIQSESEDDERFVDQAIVDENGRKISISYLRTILHRSPFIGRVRGRQNTNLGNQGGTGFLVNGNSIGLSDNRLVLVTCTHVLSAKFDGKNRLREGQAEVFFEHWEQSNGGQAFEIGSCQWESPPRPHPDGYDVSVWTVNGLPQNGTLGLPVSRRANPFAFPNNDLRQSLGSVFPIGHPGGGVLSLASGNNQIVDHDLHRDPGSPRVVHYKANTEGGSSGCPVFDEAGEIVAVHRCFTRDTIPQSPKGHSEDYMANEGIGVHSAARRCREELSN